MHTIQYFVMMSLGMALYLENFHTHVWQSGMIHHNTAVPVFIDNKGYVHICNTIQKCVSSPGEVGMQRINPKRRWPNRCCIMLHICVININVCSIFYSAVSILLLNAAHLCIKCNCVFYLLLCRVDTSPLSILFRKKCAHL